MLIVYLCALYGFARLLLQPTTTRPTCSPRLCAAIKCGAVRLSARFCNCHQARTTQYGALASLISGSATLASAVLGGEMLPWSLTWYLGRLGVVVLFLGLVGISLRFEGIGVD